MQYWINDVAEEYVSMEQNEQSNDRTEIFDCLQSFINIKTGFNRNKRSQGVRV